MEFTEAIQIFDVIRSDGDKSDSDWAELYDEMLIHAFRYAQIRAEWMRKSQAERGAEDNARTAAHNAFIDRLNILARYALRIGRGANWIFICEKDRKEIGDFACLIHCIAGLEMR